MNTINQVQLYLQLFKSPSRRAICLINNQGKVIHRFLPSKWITKIVTFLTQMNEYGYNIYITPSELKKMARRRRKDDFKEKQNILYIDVDNAKTHQRVQKYYPNPTLTILTSQNHYQLYWMLNDLVTLSQQEELMRRIAYHVKADKAATDVSRVMRLPGFKNCKRGKGDLVKIIQYNNTAYNYNELLNITPPIPIVIPHIPTPITKRTSNKRWDSFITFDEDGAVDCSVVDFKYVLHLLRYGHVEQEIKEKLLKHSPNIKTRKEDNLDLYLTLTIQKATNIVFNKEKRI